MSLGKKLRDLREATGLSQDDLAAVAGVSRNAVSQWESDRTKPAMNRLVVIARALKVSVEELVAPSVHLRKQAIEATTDLFDSVDLDQISIDAVCLAAGIQRSAFETMFASRETLLREVFLAHEERKLDEVTRAQPPYGTLSTRLKYLLHQLYQRDLKQRNLTRAMHSKSWSWSQELERGRGNQLLRLHEYIVGLFDDAAAQGQIDAGNFRAASSLLIAAYAVGLRKAIFEGGDADRTITFLEPQIAIILRGFGFRVIPGLAEEAFPIGR